ncbi:MAG: hypothetical protein H7A15_11770 [Sinobacteraceae bacterium]|nr:hypothetical protein [Nevskiaceae bacterium]
MSYHTPWRWTEGQLQGFKDGLGIDAEYRVFEMDTKRHSTPEEKVARGAEARRIIDSWKPDLLYTSDDDAQAYVTRHYLNTSMPLVFSGVNNAPASYGFDRADNVAGVLEQEHFIESIRLLKTIAPQIRRMVVVLDGSAMWEPVEKRIRARLAELPGVEIVAWERIDDYAQFQRRIGEYPKIADAIGLLGIFGFRDAEGHNVPYQKVLEWTAANSTLPDIGLWVDRVHYGTVAAVTVSEREQGLAAGRLAREILVDGKSPASLPMRPTSRGLPIINLKRAKALGLKPSSSVLLNTEVVTRYDWEVP